MDYVLNVKGGKIIVPDGKYLYFNDSFNENRERAIKTFMLHKSILEKTLSVDSNGETIVNWEKRKKIIDAENYRTRHASEEYINIVLVSLNILTFNKEGAWSFSDENMNPPWGITHEFDQSHMGIVYFVRERDILEYARAYWKDTFYNWHLFQMKNVLKKEEV